MAHDEFRFRIAGRLLVQALDRGHQLALFGCLMPSARQIKREPAQTGLNSVRHSFTQQAVSLSKSSALL